MESERIRSKIRVKNECDFECRITYANRKSKNQFRIFGFLLHKKIIVEYLIPFIFIGSAQTWLHFLIFFCFSPKHDRFHLECVHVASEEGDYSYKKASNLDESSTTVCGLYILTDVDKVVEISMKYLDASCDSGALLAVNICGLTDINVRKDNFPMEFFELWSF